MKNRITNDRIIMAMGDGIKVFDEITGLEMPIFKFALERGEDAALRKLDEMPVKKDTDPHPDHSRKTSPANGGPRKRIPTIRSGDAEKTIRVRRV